MAKVTSMATRCSARSCFGRIATRHELLSRWGSHGARAGRWSRIADALMAIRPCGSGSDGRSIRLQIGTR